MGETITACLIVRDEEARLPAALASVAFCDEVVVVDSGSTDRTVQIARATGATVVENPWPGFGVQRNVAIDHAHGDWILEVDADECVTPVLRAEIEAFLGDPPEGYVISGLPLRHRLLGGTLGPSAKYPLYRLRLFRRGTYRHDEGRAVHEGLWPRGPVWPMTGDLEHELAGSWREAVGDMWRYAALEASLLPGRPAASSVLVGVVGRPAAKLGYRLFLDGGWRDGWRGLVHIGLDCVSDVVVWLRRLASPAPATPVPGGDGHHAEQAPAAGPVKVVGVAGGARSGAQAARWLRYAAQAGAEAVLISDTDLTGDDVRVREASRCGPLLVVRALDAEEQLRAIDAVVPFGARGRRALRLAPERLRGRAGVTAPSDDVAGAVEALLAATRPAPIGSPGQ